MAVSKAIVPILNEEVSRAFRAQLKQSHIREYTDEERQATDARIMRILSEKERNKTS